MCAFLYTQNCTNLLSIDKPYPNSRYLYKIDSVKTLNLNRVDQYVDQIHIHDDGVCVP